mmetsp:Transcript_41574/g.98530  ORF Transcript_41574/g.98530 Transcript_41574/m.98530 type:complete len:189 (-) Transcript_41574:44-610(-)
MLSTAARLVALLAIGSTSTNAFTVSAGVHLQKSQMALSLRRSVNSCRLRMQSQPESEVDPRAWEPMTDPATGRTYYVNPATGESAWERPSPKSLQLQDGEKAPSNKIYFAVDEEVRDQRWNKFQKIMEAQKAQDEMKRKEGPAGGRKFQALSLAAVVLGIPLLVLAVGFSTGTLPNPFEVCVEGGTSC